MGWRLRLHQTVHCVIPYLARECNQSGRFPHTIVKEPACSVKLQFYSFKIPSKNFVYSKLFRLGVPSGFFWVLLLLPNVGNCPLINEHVLNIHHEFIHALWQGLQKSFGTSTKKISLTSQSSRIQTNLNLNHIPSFVISTSQEYAEMSELRTK